MCFVVPDGTGIRNYLFSNILKTLHKNGANIWIWHSLTDNAIYEIKKVHPYANIKDKKLPAYKESLLEVFLRESIAYARLLNNSKKVDNKTILLNWRKNPKKIIHKMFYKLTKLYGQYLSKKYTRIIQADKYYFQIVNKNKQQKKFQNFLQMIKADCVICTHQRAISAIPVMQAANILNLNTISAIYSWDNMPKARLAIRSKKYIVWSSYMKDEMKLYYPEINENDTVITGTPQFEFYYDHNFIIDKVTFFKKYNLDINKKTICYSGDDRLTSPYDPDYLSDLAESILNSEFKNRVQILLRRAPIDLSGRFNSVVNQYSEIIKVVDPIWHFDGEDSKHWTLVYPSMNDVSLLVNIAYHCDIVCNVGSTMALDFAIYNKPAAYLNYDVPHVKNWSTKTIYEYQHFKSMKNYDAVIWINSKDEIAAKLYEALESPDTVAPDRIKWLDTIVQDRKNASANIVKVIQGK